ncbi:levansucrase [Clostridium pasteurianum DSM 525 = ATCC 6013]|uniref:Levansucrase n=1 Tax=Clostridium pasteurianum DSM 525 = ATCC 6013 TaxID=1262449 RepID=A0A0H3J026_CLOPA|nr:glycoside hydrolase family 68 protein [Clostridium pasteurianum]AJA46669.1 levansucrase [Clostridium pasteurianum DSM 525 = ATCC 6013]AJA50657.1 levansucrase [Clostridium pasteurianum DSM 525 = ATCC 6013]ELP61234.1 levansucrase SacB [Clostridium pasteurianum DSM 525 = ATCC 6013]KRU13331.1 Levansucrase [Clostridium pasteurianum DSM 525 = ATCC 6013]
MIKSKISKFLFSTTLISCLIGSGSLAFAKESNSTNYKETYGISHITREDMLKIPAQQNNAQFKVPQFDASTLKNIPSAKGYDEAGNLIDLDVWDSWPLQNGDGTVSNYHGYNIVFALAGDPKRGWDTHIYLFYQKIGDTSIDSWKCAGRVFKDSDKFLSDDPILHNQAEEWSGSATLTQDGKVRLFYTNRDSWSIETGHYGKQTLTTAQINLSKPDSSTLKIEGVEDLKSIFDGGDGTIYQNVAQFVQASDPSTNTWDNHTLRDPHYIEDNGRKYLVFEANTGTTDGYQGDQSLYNRAYYGGSAAFFKSERDKLLQSPKKQLASFANGALGIIELNNDYTLKKVMKPLITSNTITDEIERANIFKMNGKWYLFTDSRGSKMTIDGIDDKQVYMLGFVADSLTGSYKPLNGSGLVLNMNLDPADLTFTYSHFAVPQRKGNNVVITSYITNRGLFSDHHSTFAPSFLLKIQGQKTSVVPNSILPQGQLTIDK